MEIKNLNKIIGDHPANIISEDVQQIYNDTCAIKSQQLILNDFGIQISEDQLVQQAENLNIYHPGQGTSPEDVGKLLEINGVHCTQHENASIYDLTSALAKGEKVIIGVDSSELWDAGIISETNDIITGEKADHALIVAGIDTSNPNDVYVILTDPGTGQEGARYPIDQFLDAWHDSGNFMVTTDVPAPLAYNPEMINFDYTIGHLPMIGNLPYEYFEQTFLPLSQSFDNDPLSKDILLQNFSDLIMGDIDIYTLNEIDPTFADVFKNMIEINNKSIHGCQISDFQYEILHDQEMTHFEIKQDNIDHLNIDDLLTS